HSVDAPHWQLLGCRHLAQPRPLSRRPVICRQVGFEPEDRDETPRLPIGGIGPARSAEDELLAVWPKFVQLLCSLQGSSNFFSAELAFHLDDCQQSLCRNKPTVRTDF